MNKLTKVEFDYQWLPVLREEEKEYYFPDKMSSFMKNEYKKPAIYRWNVFKTIRGDQKIIYIGETQELCPQRINGYLNPGPSQHTNKRIKRKFEAYLANGFKIGLDILQFSDIKIENFVIRYDDLKDKHIRRLIEELMIIIHEKMGYTILNR